LKAIVIHEHGGLDKLKYEEVDKPKISPEEVLIQVKASSLNHLDIFVRNGIPGIKIPLPHILGSDCSGIVAEVGSEVRRVKVGDRVTVNPGRWCGRCEFCVAGEQSLCPYFQIMGEHVDGAWAEFVKVPEESVHPIPGGLSFEEAAAFPLVFLTAWRMLITRAALKPGETVLIIGIGGGVAMAAMQIAKYAGAKVIVTSGSQEKLQKALSLGADIGINHREQDFAAEIAKLTGKRGVDVVVDSVGADTWQKCILSLAKGGRLVTCGATSGPNPKEDLLRIFWKQLSILGSTMGNQREFNELLRAFDTGRLKPIIDQVYPLAEAAKALQRLEEQAQFGKIVLTVS
jgi:NADPH:quinone reductase-like Zn-dependent oxidoreductase